jgi:hypothetical protein
MTDSSLTELKRQHKALGKEIKKMQANPAGESLVISGLKRQKLSVKEQIKAHGGVTSGMAAEEKLAAAQAQLSQPTITPAASAVLTPEEELVQDLLPPLNPPYVDGEMLGTRSTTAVLESAAELPAACYGRIPKRA